jgi:hypothetical protein
MVIRQDYSQRGRCQDSPASGGKKIGLPYRSGAARAGMRITIAKGTVVTPGTGTPITIGRRFAAAPDRRFSSGH